MQANEEIAKNEIAAKEEVKVRFPPGTIAFQVDAAVTIAPGYEGVDLSRLEIKAGDILFLVPVDGKYCHMDDEGRLVIDGELRGHAWDL